MRKEIRYGLGIGTLALAFIGTYVIVKNHTENQAALLQGDDQADAGSDSPGAEVNTAAPASGGGAISNSSAVLPPTPLTTTITPTVPTHPPTVPAHRDVFDPRPESSGGHSAPTMPPVASKGSGQDGGGDWDSVLRDGPVAAAPVSAPEARANHSAPQERPHITVPPRVETAMAKKEKDPVVLPRPQIHAGDVAANTGRAYTILEGDTFVSIAKAAYGNGKYYLQIEEANRGTNPNRLKIGQQIVLPELSAKARAARTPGPYADVDNRVINAQLEYRVDSGDSLYRISTRLFGTARMVDELYELNKSVIGPNPERLRLGMILKLPQTARAGR